MLFEPYNDEYDRINLLKKFVSNNYSIIRLTKTMINKNNIDANYFLQTLLKDNKVVDYDKLQNGGNNGIKYSAIVYSKGKIFPTTIKFYKVKNKRGDPRFGLYSINKMYKENYIGVGDLLALVPSVKDKARIIYLFNVSFDLPDENKLFSLFGLNQSQQLFKQIFPKIKKIAQQGFHPNSKGKGEIDDKDAGDTLESLLNIETNNRESADINGLIELKTKKTSGLETLFTLRPSFEGTPVANIEPKDRNRVSAYTRLYGYNSSKHPNAKSLFVTIKSSCNNQGLFLKVNESDELVEIRKRLKNESILTAYWNFNTLEKHLKLKHPMTLWFDVKSKMVNNVGEFSYPSVQITQVPSFETFISLIKANLISYDWRGYTSISGNYTGRNHGNAWRIEKNSIPFLFGNSKTIDLSK